MKTLNEHIAWGMDAGAFYRPWGAIRDDATEARWLDEQAAALEKANSVRAALDKAGYAIVPKEPTRAKAEIEQLRNALTCAVAVILSNTPHAATEIRLAHEALGRDLPDWWVKEYGDMDAPGTAHSATEGGEQ